MRESDISQTALNKSLHLTARQRVSQVALFHDIEGCSPGGR
jgi:hypothetical protein